LRVEEQDIITKGQDTAFVEALTQWEILPWIKYLREHGSICHVEHTKNIEINAQMYTVFWDLPPHHQTYFYLLYQH
jgi:hypothetical protein